MIDYLPSPLDKGLTKGSQVDDKEKEMVRKPADEEPFAGLAFKIMTDPFVGSLTFVRIYSGVLSGSSYVLNPGKSKKERVGRLLLMHANTREDIKEARAGDIVAVAGLKDTYTGDTLCDPDSPILLERMEFPEPVIKASARSAFPPPRCLVLCLFLVGACTATLNPALPGPPRRWRLSPRPRETWTRWAWGWPSWRRRTRRSASSATRRPTRRSSR